MTKSRGKDFFGLYVQVKFIIEEVRSGTKQELEAETMGEHSLLSPLHVSHLANFITQFRQSPTNTPTGQSDLSLS